MREMKAEEEDKKTQTKSVSSQCMLSLWQCCTGYQHSLLDSEPVIWLNS
jgi:hypothetical protein